MSQPRVLIVAGSDSGGGAGIQADIKTVTMMGGFAMTAVTAITAQNTLGVDAMMPVPADMVLSQVDAVLSDLGADAIKIGMIGSAETAAALARRLAPLRLPIVFDPVMVATSGSLLADAATTLAFERLMGIATVVTPNLPELEILYGRTLRSHEDVVDAALALHRRHRCAVLAKGGHGGGSTVTDTLVVRGEAFRHDSSRVATDHTHGTGCTLASAVATGLAMGQSLERAVAEGIRYVQEAIKAAPGFGRGHGPIGHTLGVSPWDTIHKKVRR
jgi:hydroxymethylpyrimidine/phosphomethylpyrimidine kinase